jgi:adenylate cyclase
MLPATARTGLPYAVRTVVGVAAAVILANLVGIATVAALLIGLNANAPHDQRSVLVTVSAVYVAVATALGTLIGVTLHKRTLRWLASGRVPDRHEARQALRTPIDLALLCGTLWLGGAVVISSLVGGLGGVGDDIGEIASGIVLAGASTAAITFIIVARITRPVTQLALTAYPPRRSLLLSVRARMLFAWLLTTGVPVLGIILILTAPPQRSHVRGAGIILGCVALGVGLLANTLVARGIGIPLRNLLDVLHRVGEGHLDRDVIVDDPGEIGLLQNGVNEMLAGLRERERIRDLFGRHVGPAVAQEALRRGVTLTGETRDVVALFVDITGSTTLAREVDPAKFVAMLNEFFGVVVAAVEDNGGLVNKFEGDAALCVFGAPMELDDPATAALRTARRIRDEVCGRGEFDVGIGVAAGPVVAGQIGAAERLEYTVIGPAVNEASRLTDLAKKCPARVLVSAGTIEAASPAERGRWREADTVTLRGHQGPMRTYTTVEPCARVADPAAASAADAEDDADDDDAGSG